MVMARRFLFVSLKEIFRVSSFLVFCGLAAFGRFEYG